MYILNARIPILKVVVPLVSSSLDETMYLCGVVVVVGWGVEGYSTITERVGWGIQFIIFDKHYCLLRSD